MRAPFPALVPWSFVGFVAGALATRLYGAATVLAFVATLLT